VTTTSLEASGSVAPLGDVFLAQVRAPVPNHGGVYLDGGLILHHLEGRLSRREPLGPWRRFVTHALRCANRISDQFEFPDSAAKRT